MSFYLSSKILATRKYTPVSPKTVAEKFKINYLRAITITHNLYKRGLLRKIRKGEYVSTDMAPAFPRTTQILLLLEDKRSSLSRREIATHLQ